MKHNGLPKGCRWKAPPPVFKAPRTTRGVYRDWAAIRAVCVSRPGAWLYVGEMACGNTPKFRQRHGLDCVQRGIGRYPFMDTYVRYVRNVD